MPPSTGSPNSQRSCCIRSERTARATRAPFCSSLAGVCFSYARLGAPGRQRPAGGVGLQDAAIRHAREWAHTAGSRLISAGIRSRPRLRDRSRGIYHVRGRCAGMERVMGVEPTWVGRLRSPVQSLTSDDRSACDRRVTLRCSDAPFIARPRRRPACWSSRLPHPCTRCRPDRRGACRPRP